MSLCQATVSEIHDQKHKRQKRKKKKVSGPYQKLKHETSLVVQWLRPWASSAAESTEIQRCTCHKLPDAVQRGAH